MRRGRPTKYRPKYCKKIIEYFSRKPYEIVDGKEIPNDPPAMFRFAASIGVEDTTLEDWTKKFPEFYLAYKKAQKLQENFVVVNAMRDNYAQAFSIFYMKNVFRWQDRIEHTGADGEPLTIKVVNYAKIPALKKIHANGNGNHAPA